MSLDTVHDIERAIETLSPQELENLYVWLDRHYPQPFDERLQSGLEAGHLDEAIDRALEDEKNQRVRPL